MTSNGLTRDHSKDVLVDLKSDPENKGQLLRQRLERVSQLWDIPVDIIQDLLKQTYETSLVKVQPRMYYGLALDIERGVSNALADPTALGLAVKTSQDQVSLITKIYTNLLQITEQQSDKLKPVSKWLHSLQSARQAQIPGWEDLQPGYITNLREIVARSGQEFKTEV